VKHGAVDVHGRLKRRRRAALLRALGLDPALAWWVAGYPVRCACGRRAAAIGVFWSGTTCPGERYRNAMYLCPACAAQVDRGVRVVWIGSHKCG